MAAHELVVMFVQSFLRPHCNFSFEIINFTLSLSLDLSLRYSSMLLGWSVNQQTTAIVLLVDGGTQFLDVFHMFLFPLTDI